MSAAAVAPAVTAPEPVRMRRVVLGCPALAAVAAGALQVADQDLSATLLGACTVLALALGAVFCLRAVTVTGFAAGAGAAGVVLLAPGSLPLVLLAALLLAVACGLAPAWHRAEAWQAARAAAVPAAPAPGRRWPAALWRSDRVVAAFLVLAFPPGVTAAATAFVSWSLTR